MRELNLIKEKILESISDKNEDSIFIDLSGIGNKNKVYAKGVKTEMFQICEGLTLLVDIDNETNFVVSIEII